MPTLPSAFVSRLAAPALALLLVTGSALAGDFDNPAAGGPQFQGMIRRAALDCAGDAHRLCANISPGQGRIVRCLAGQRDAVSPTCRGHLDKAVTAYEAQATCSADVAKHCPGVSPGGGRLVSCLFGNREKLSPACRSSLEQATSQLQR